MSSDHTTSSKELRFTGKLFPYQQKVLEWTREIDAGILGLDMGLGKTVITLAMICEKHINRVLIVVPLPIVEQWRKAFLQFTTLPATQISVYQGSHRKVSDLQKRVVLTTYDVVRMEMANDRSSLALNKSFDGIIFDEAHKLRNNETQTHQQCAKLVQGTEHRWLLSGTVIVNDFTDVYNLFRFLEIPNLSFTLFSRSQSIAVVGDSVKKPSSTGPSRNSNEEIRQMTEMDRLAWRDRYYYRLTKEQCLTDLPRKTIETHHLEFDETHFGEYFEIFLEVKELYKTFQQTRTKVDWDQILVKILRLRQSCNHPEAIISSETQAEAPVYEGPVPAKFQKIAEILDAISKNDQMIIFSQWSSSLQLLGQFLTEKGYSFLEYNGDMSISARNQVLRRFEGTNAPRVLLITLTAGGLGLNLTSANHVILLDPWWNSAIEEQAIDRVYRLGQTKPVTVHRLVMNDSIEQWMWKMKEEKTKVSQAFHNHGLMEHIDHATLSTILHHFI